VSRTATVVVVLVSAYIGAQVLADVASLRIIEVAGVTMDGGTLIYPFTFTLRDLVHKAAGIATARALIFTAAAVNVVMALLFKVVAVLPPDLEVGPQDEFGVVLSPVIRIVVASIVAEVLSELIDTEVYRMWVDRFAGRWQWGRVLASNAVSVPIDSVVFAVIAFGGVFAAGSVVAIIWGNILVKGIVTAISIPWIYLIRGRSAEGLPADQG
jgi:queuosine precursor transporter